MPGNIGRMQRRPGNLYNKDSGCMAISISIEIEIEIEIEMQT